jgi:hypothetical protein
MLEMENSCLNILKTEVFTFPHNWNHEICIKCAHKVLSRLKKEECIYAFHLSIGCRCLIRAILICHTCLQYIYKCSSLGLLQGILLLMACEYPILTSNRNIPFRCVIWQLILKLRAIPRQTPNHKFMKQRRCFYKTIICAYAVYKSPRFQMIFLHWTKLQHLTY